MKEEFLHHVWKHQLWNTMDLNTINNETIIVKKIGQYNRNSGPDFLNSQIIINEQLWVGNVEIHKKSSDWEKHKHQNDAAYNNVILHVVFRNDKKIFDNNLREIPTLETQGLISKSLLGKYNNLNLSKAKIPCNSFLKEIDIAVFQDFSNQLILERLEDKSKLLSEKMQVNKNDIEATFYSLICKSIGLKINAQPMEILSEYLPFQLVRKHQHNIMQLTALFFGVSGFLQDDFTEDYPQKLQVEFKYLKHKYNLKIMEKSLWKFLRLRPASFPTIRLAQLVAIFSKYQNLVSLILEAKDKKELKNIFTVTPDKYWDTHYTFDNISRKIEKKIGEKSIEIIIINAVVPLLYFYEKKDSKIIQNAIDFLKDIKAERNTITKKFSESGLPIKSAKNSQAIIQLYNNYCSLKKCLNCKLGKHILGNA
ncbi:MAG: DUF2851 family protein [Flavobacteriales bacterium]|nr:DUF2851 family protein [Flavobacteriales bacterium]